MVLSEVTSFTLSMPPLEACQPSSICPISLMWLTERGKMEIREERCKWFEKQTSEGERISETISHPIIGAAQYICSSAANNCWASLSLNQFYSGLTTVWQMLGIHYLLLQAACARTCTRLMVQLLKTSCCGPARWVLSGRFFLNIWDLTWRKARQGGVAAAADVEGHAYGAGGRQKAKRQNDTLKQKFWLKVFRSCNNRPNRPCFKP